MLCLTYTHSPSDAAHPQALCVYIKQSTLACVITYAYNIVILTIEVTYQPNKIA